MSARALDLPPSAIPRRGQLPAKLRRAFKNMGHEVPKDLASWSWRRMYATWFRLAREREARTREARERRQRGEEESRG